MTGQTDFTQLYADVLGVIAYEPRRTAMLDQITQLLEETIDPDSFLTMTMLTQDQDEERLTFVAAPSAPGLVSRWVVPGPAAGSCGTAVFSGKSVYVSNVRSDERWATLRSLATEFRIESCWSQPVFGEGRLLGTVAISNRFPGLPDEEARELLQIMARLVGVALSRIVTEDERAAVERQVMRVQKLSDLGLLAGGIAHDFNNLLVTILGSVDLALDAAPPGADLAEHLARIQASAQHGAALCRRVLSFAGPDQGALDQPIAVRLLLEQTLALVHAADKRVALEVKDDLAPIMGSFDQLQQVVMNLVLNGLAAGAGTVQLCGGEAAVDLGAGDWLLQPPTGPAVSIAVSDSGAGMEPHVLARIFDPFYTTREEGNGLGLSAVQGILRRHGAGLRVETEVGVGTTFEIVLRTRPRG